MAETQEKTETIVLVGNGYWGRGTTLEEAKKKFRNAGGTLSGGYGILTFDKDTEFHGIDNHGNYEFTGNRPEITTVKPRK